MSRDARTPRALESALVALSRPARLLSPGPRQRAAWRVGTLYRQGSPPCRSSLTWPVCTADRRCSMRHRAEPVYARSLGSSEPDEQWSVFISFFDATC